MPHPDPTHIGHVRHILGSQVTVVLDDDLAGADPIYRGRIQRIGQIGSIVRLPQGPVDLVAQVILLGISELADVEPPAEVIQTGDRWLQIQLLGEIDRSTHQFQRGIGSYPGLEDPVHFATVEDLAAVYPPNDDTRLQIGRLAAAEELPVSLDAGRLVFRHSAVVGSTGAGKTTTVAAILQRFARGGWPAANIIVIDPHGEYSEALGEDAAVRSVLGAEDDRLQVPYWALPADSIMTVFAGSTGNAVTRERIRELVTEGRRNFADQANWISLDPTAITADTPIPFDIRQIWHKLDWENNETRETKGDPSTACVDEPGDSTSLTPAKFAPYSQGSAAPFKSPEHGKYGRTPELLKLGLRDPRLAFFREPVSESSTVDPLVGVLLSWLGGTQPVSVLDFSGVPSSASELAIGVVMDLLFEVAVRSDPQMGGVGRNRPILIVLEEAHRYLADAAAPIARNAANRIAREGRKYGVGLMLITQRPSELPDTALAQCGTLIALRLTNSADQSRISAALPDSVTGLAEVLPSLRTGEAVITGESLIIPSRALINKPSPLPAANDPSLASWRDEPTEPDLAPALAAWRGIYDGDQ